MDPVDRFVDAFNRGDVGALSELAAPGYSYAEPVAPTPVDTAGHIELMTQTLAAYPDRRIDVRRRVPGPQGAVLEGTWQGTPAAGGDPLVLDCVFVFDLDASAERIERARTYYAFG